jgi:ribonuclease J
MGFGDHEFKTFRTGDRTKVGSIEVEPIHVDHSTPGAYGFIIHTSEECIAYTGDLRMHGPRGDMTVDFIKKARDSKPDVLICEGTRVAPEDARKNLTEEGVGDKAKELISDTDKLAIVSFYPKDVDRMRTFRDVARVTGRKFVVSAKVANLLEALKDDPNIESPDPLTDENMLIYVRKMASPDRVKYEKRYIDLRPGNDHVVDSEYVKEHQTELIFHTDFFQLAELIDVGPQPHSLFIRSKSEPFEEDDVQEQVLQNWMDRFQLDFDSAHASGHASMQEIITIVDEIAPKVVIPVHTEHPTLFKKAEPKVLLPKARQAIALGDD